MPAPGIGSNALAYFTLLSRCHRGSGIRALWVIPLVVYVRLMPQWTVVLDKQAAKSLDKLPKEIVEILAQLRQDLETEGPMPKGWIVKPLRGRSGVMSARLKRKYRALYEVVSPTIIIVSVSHRKEAY